MERFIYRKRIIRPHAGRFLTRMVSEVDARNRVTFGDDPFMGIWRGRYKDLKEEQLTITAWLYHK